MLIDVIVAFQFPDFAVPHDIDDFELAYKIVNEKLNGLNTEMIFKLLYVCSFIHDFHDVFGSLFVVNSVNAGLWEPFWKLLHDMVASFHDFGSWEWLHFQEGVACVSLLVPEFILILSITTSYRLLS